MEKLKDKFKDIYFKTFFETSKYVLPYKLEKVNYNKIKKVSKKKNES